jgi:archaellin
VVVKVVPSGYKFVHAKIDIAKVPREHFRHVEKTETVKTKVNPESGAATIQKETTTTVKE